MRRITALILIYAFATLGAQQNQVISARRRAPSSSPFTILTTYTCNGQGNGTPASTISCTWQLSGVNTALPANALEACEGNGGTSANTYAMTNSHSDVFNMQGSISSLGSASQFSQNGWFRPTVTTTTATLNLTLPSTFAQIKCQAASGGAASPADGQSTIDVPTAVSGTKTASPTITASSSTDFVFVPCSFAGGTTITAGSGFTIGSNNGSNNPVEYQIASSTSITPTIVVGAAGSGGCVVSAFHP